MSACPAGQVEGLAAAAGHTLQAEEMTVGGATLGSLYRRSGSDRNVRAAIATGDYDVVVMQEASVAHCPPCTAAAPLRARRAQRVPVPAWAWTVLVRPTKTTVLARVLECAQRPCVPTCVRA